MILVAAGKLSITQKDIKLIGWAIEAASMQRILIEFLPSIEVNPLSTSAEIKDKHCIVRNDTGVYEGGEISMCYDHDR